MADEENNGVDLGDVSQSVEHGDVEVTEVNVADADTEDEIGPPKFDFAMIVRCVERYGRWQIQQDGADGYLAQIWHGPPLNRGALAVTGRTPELALAGALVLALADRVEDPRPDEDGRSSNGTR